MVDTAELEYAREAGLRSGEEIGKEIGQERVIMRLLARRFGPVPDDVDRKIDALTSDQLDDFADVLLDFTSYDDVQGWLAAH